MVPESPEVDPLHHLAQLQMDDPESNRRRSGSHHVLPTHLRLPRVHSKKTIGRLVYLHNAQNINIFLSRSTSII